MDVVFMGTPDFAVPSLRQLYENGYNVKAVFTQPDKPKGRGYKLTPPPVKQEALSHNTEVFQPDSLKKNAEKYIDLLKKLNPEVIVVAAYGKILPKDVLEIPKYGCINVHGSLLPKYRGAAPIQWAILNGEEETGITTMLMNEGVDTGDILLQKKTLIGKNETASELFDRLSAMGGQLLIQTLEGIANKSILPIAQNQNEATYAPMLSKELCRIDFNKNTLKVHNQICGLSEWPCAVTMLNGKRLKVYKSEVASVKQHDFTPGEVVNEKDFTVACRDGTIRLMEVQAEGSKRMSAEDYLRGRHIDRGILLG